jgi:hypothetical protein
MAFAARFGHSPTHDGPAVVRKQVFLSAARAPSTDPFIGPDGVIQTG